MKTGLSDPIAFTSTKGMPLSKKHAVRLIRQSILVSHRTTGRAAASNDNNNTDRFNSRQSLVAAKKTLGPVIVQQERCHTRTAAMAFSVFVEMINLWIRKRSERRVAPVKLHEKYAEDGQAGIRELRRRARSSGAPSSVLARFGCNSDALGSPRRACSHSIQGT
jgi:hypothetical protein